METSQPLCVPDASVLIDMKHGDVLTLLFALGYRWQLPDVALVELQSLDTELLRTHGVAAARFGSQEVRELRALREKHRGLSLADCAVLLLAKRERGVLLTSDRVLRRIATTVYGLEVRGTLWLLDQLINAELMTRTQAVHALERMLARGSRLPRAECEKRLAQWRQG